MKATVEHTDREAKSWSLSWQPDGRCNSFTKDTILEYAPPTSGVYGLFNFDCQIFIGAAENIRDALLHHESETNFQSAHLRPTGFTFEPCGAELYKSRVDELIARFRPVMQSEAALADSQSPSTGTAASAAGQRQLRNQPGDQDFPPQDHEERPKARRDFHLKRPWVATFTTIFCAVSVAVFYFGIPAHRHGMSGAMGTVVSGNPATHPASSGAAEIGLKPQNAPSIGSEAAAVTLNAEIAPANSKANDSLAHPNGMARLAVKNSSDADGSEAKKTPAEAPESARSSARSTSGKKWSVQISAAPAQDIADTLVQRLKVKGYDGYTVQAQVNGQTYYRVRVGNFDARDQAESVRQALARQEGYRDAYLIGD